MRQASHPGRQFGDSAIQYTFMVNSLWMGWDWERETGPREIQDSLGRRANPHSCIFG